MTELIRTMEAVMNEINLIFQKASQTKRTVSEREAKMCLSYAKQAEELCNRINEVFDR